MSGWEITATTIYCDAVEDEVTLVAEKDRTLRCTGYNRYFSPDKDITKSIKRRSEQLKKKLVCEGLDCYRVKSYRDKLYSEQT